MHKIKNEINYVHSYNKLSNDIYVYIEINMV